ncbi:MAG: hypothetical protein MJ191_01430 [Clostridium sp.]|nr:hypothetical protein [Clostridium sp.]
MKDKKKSSKKENADDKDNISNEEQQQLNKELFISNISIWALFLILYAIIITIQFLYWQRSKILDSINNTNYAETLEDLTEVPKKVNLIYLITTSIFAGITWDTYNTVKNQKESTCKEIEDAYKRLLAILLFLLANSINFDVLNS